MATTSQIPEFIDALYSTAFGALAATTTVIDGPPLTWGDGDIGLTVPVPAVSETQFLFIGASPDDNTTARGNQDRTTLGSGRGEDINVPCTAYVAGGDETMKPLRDAAFALVAALEQAIRVDQTLGGQVATSRVANVDRLDQTQNGNGGDATVIFTVTGKAYLR